MAALGSDADARYKELELYADDEPSSEWGLDTEVQGVRPLAEAAGFHRFHLVGYSGGGACALAFCVAHPERLLSLTLNPDAQTQAARDLRTFTTEVQQDLLH